MSKGTIILVPFPFTDLSGHKVRPALVIYEEKRGEDCVVVFISSLTTKKVGPFEVTIKATETNGLKVDSLLKVSKIATLQKKIILGELGRLEDKILKAVDNCLKSMFHL